MMVHYVVTDHDLFPGFSRENFGYFLGFLLVLASTFPHVFALWWWDRIHACIGKNRYPISLPRRQAKKEGRDQRRVAAIVAFRTPRPELWSVPGIVPEKHSAFGIGSSGWGE